MFKDKRLQFVRPCPITKINTSAHKIFFSSCFNEICWIKEKFAKKIVIKSTHWSPGEKYLLSYNYLPQDQINILLFINVQKAFTPWRFSSGFPRFSSQVLLQMHRMKKKQIVIFFWPKS